MKLMRAVIVLVLVFLVFSLTAFAQPALQCSGKAGAGGDFKIKNELDFDIEIKSVLPDCTERKGITVGAGKFIEVSAYVNQVFRVYENLSDRVLTHVRFVEGITDYRIEGFLPSEKDPEKLLCSRDGDSSVFFVRNATGKPIVVKFVTPDCTEQPGPEINPGKQNGGQTFINNVFRAYDKSSGEMISQFVIRPGQRNYVIGGEKDPIPAKSFIRTVNAFRSHTGIGDLELNKTLTATCQWFAEYMATKDQKHAGHVLSDFKEQDRSLRKFNTPDQRLIEFGWKKRKAGDNAETTALVKIDDPQLIGAYFAMEWSSSTTHFKPFYDLYRTRYKKVGFAAVASPSDSSLYYGCAIFANEGRGN